MNNINNKTFEHRPISELMAIVRNDLKKFNDEGLIDEGTIIKTVQWCNDRLGIPIREIKEICLTVENFKAKLPINFEKLYFTGAVTATNTSVLLGRNPFNNNFDRDVIYDAKIDRGSFGNVDSYSVVINRKSKVTVHSTTNLIGIDVHPHSFTFCHPSCPNTRKKGKYTVEIKDGYILTPFKTGELYIMYLSTMMDDEGNVLFPFHPLITPWYEWTIVEKVLIDAAFNSDIPKEDIEYLRNIAKVKVSQAWADAFDITTTKGYGEYVDMQRKKELGWYNQYFKYFQ